MSQPINENVTELIDERVKVYGDPTVTFPQIAQAWSAVLGVQVRPDQVPLCLIAMKLVRTSQTPDYSDNSDDIEGYLDIFRKVVGKDMVHARTVDEYVKQKHPVSYRSEKVDLHVFLDPIFGAYRCTTCDWQLLKSDAPSIEAAKAVFTEYHSMWSTTGESKKNTPQVRS